MKWHLFSRRFRTQKSADQCGKIKEGNVDVLVILFKDIHRFRSQYIIIIMLMFSVSGISALSAWLDSHLTATQPAVAETGFGSAAILETLDPDCLGCGSDMYTNGSSEHAMAFGLIASAGAVMKDEKIASKAADWLIRNAHPAPGTTGWGLSFEWDAFADGTVNSADTVYGITTALAVRGLLDAYQLTNRKEYREAALQALAYYSRFFTKTVQGGYFWYSNQPSDNVNVLNVSAMLMGQYARIGIKTGNDTFVRLAEEAHKDLLSHVKTIGSLSYWIYDAKRPNQKPNDAVHAAYVVQGLIDYAAAMGSSGPNRRIVQYLKTFQRNGIALTWSDTHNLREHFKRQTAKLWGPGMLAYTLVEGGELDAAKQYANALRTYHEPSSGMRTTLDGSATSDPRMVAHALLGLARLESAVEKTASTVFP